METWRPIVGYEGAYEVSSLGRVRALDRITDRGRKWRGKQMAVSTMPRGYKVVTLWRDGKQRTFLVHRLVLSAFVGPAPEDTEALHADGNPANNTVTNLRWGTHSENQQDQLAHGTHFMAAKTHCLKGHPFDETNTYYYPDRVHRACRTCRRDWMREFKQKRSAA